MPIVNIKLVMMASAVVLAAQHFCASLMSGKVAQPSTAPGGHGKWNSVWPTSNASANYKRQGEVNRWVGLMLSSPPQPPPSTAWERRLTTSHSRRPMTPQSYNSSRRQTWLSPFQTPCSWQPTRSSQKLRLRFRQPRRSFLECLSLPTNHFLGITVVLMAIVSARITRVPPAAARPRVTRTR